MGSPPVPLEDMGPDPFEREEESELDREDDLLSEDADPLRPRFGSPQVQRPPDLRREYVLSFRLRLDRDRHPRSLPYPIKVNL